MKTYPISSSIIDEDGNFKLTYAKTDFGVGYLMSADNKYYVFGTPTMFLLDKKREIILRPISVQQMDAWVDWFLKK